MTPALMRFYIGSLIVAAVVQRYLPEWQWYVAGAVVAEAAFIIWLVGHRAGRATQYERMKRAQKGLSRLERDLGDE